MHRLLKRQINRHLGSLDAVPESWERFFHAVSEAYQQSDTDRQILEHANELNSQELLELNSQIRAAIPDNFLRIDKQSILLDYKPGQNQKAYLPCEQVLGKPLKVLLPEGVSQKFVDAIDDLDRRNLAEVSIVHNLFFEGEERFYEVRLLPLLENQVVAIARDITDRKQAEAKLKQTNEELLRATRLKDEFLANMSHELRTPLNAILGMTEGLQEEVFGSLNTRQQKALVTVERSGCHLLELINDVLDVAKIESGQIELALAPAEIEPLCKSSLAFIKQLALKKRIQIETQLPEKLPNISIDERRIRQVLINLLNNAVKFTTEGGRITLQVSHQRAGQLLGSLKSSSSSRELEQDHLRIAVTDTGIGIAPEYINKLFQPFIQIDSALNRQYQGTGLGLALVKRIVELHGGCVGLTSQVGMGSCFTIDLPCQDSNLQLSELDTISQGSIEYPESNLVDMPLILLAEDNEANISTFSSYLEAKGYRLVLAKNGQEAIALARANMPDLILMDVQMPGVDGLEATRQIRLSPALDNIPIIALTALAMEGDRDRCLAAGANDYLSKPVKLKVLLRNIQCWLNGRNQGNLNGLSKGCAV